MSEELSTDFKSLHQGSLSNSLSLPILLKNTNLFKAGNYIALFSSLNFIEVLMFSVLHVALCLMKKE